MAEHPDVLSPETTSLPAPRGALDRFVQQIQVISRSPDEPALHLDYLPDGTTSLVLRWLGGDAVDAGVRGPFTSAYAKIAPAIRLVLRVVFRPGGAYPFFGVPVDHLTERMVSLRDLWGPGGAILEEQFLAAARTGGDVAAPVTRALVDRLRTAPFEPASALAARAAVGLLAPGDLAIDDVARALGLSPRHLRRAFQATVGIPPKTFARIARFQRALARGRAAPGRWSEVALATGYFDQAHLIAEFQKLALVSPGALDARAQQPRNVCR